MMVRGSVPSLIQGISQQTPTLRPPGYIEDGLNLYGTTIEGLARRPPSSFVTLIASLVDPKAYHWSDRDESERYLVVADEGILKVFNFNGDAQSVSAPDGWDYVGDGSSLGFLTINDYTFVWDRNKTVALGTETETGTTPEGMAFIRQGDYGCAYKVNIGYPVESPTWLFGNTTVSATDVADIQPDNVAAEIASSLVANLGADWEVEHKGHVVWVRRVDGEDFLMTAHDSATGRNIIAIKDRVTKFSDLSTIGRNDLHIRISGDEANDKDDWYAKFVTTGGEDLGEGFWKECPKPGTKIALDAATMPHVLVREADGTFTFREADWGKRVAGSETSHPPPSFVGKKIAGMGAGKSRLEFFGPNLWATSRAADLFNLWPLSAQLQVDTDPIDVSPPYPRPYTLRGSAEFQKGLILFADNVQFIVSSGDIFGPKTIAVKPLSTFNLDPTRGLFGLQQDRVLCALKREKHTGLMTFRTPSQSLSDMVFDESSAVVPALMPGAAEWIAASATENSHVMKVAGSDYLYSYKETEDAGRIIQSAWQPWSFPGRVPVTGHFVGTDLHLVLRDAEGVFSLERISLRPLASDQLTWDIFLDRRAELTEGAFEASGSDTEVTLPWTPTADETVLLVITEGPQAGAVVKASGTGEMAATFPGLYTGPGVVGVVARSWAKPSPFYYRKPLSGGGEEVVTNGTLQILRVKVSYGESGPFSIRIKPKDRVDEFVERIASPLFEDGGYEGPQDLQAGSADFPVGCINDRVEIIFDTGESPMPMRIANVEWSGDLNLQARPL